MEYKKYFKYVGATFNTYNKNKYGWKLKEWLLATKLYNTNNTFRKEFNKYAGRKTK